MNTSPQPWASFFADRMLENPAAIEFLEEEIARNIGDVLVWGVALQRRVLVTMLPKIGKVHVYADHNPPHFHVRLPDRDLAIAYDTCKIMEGEGLSGKQVKDLRNWYFNQGGQKLVTILWNKCNPDKQLEVA